MIRTVLSMLAGLWMAQAAAAETVRVRTAEHGQFTRVVVDFSGAPAWTLGRVGSAYELRTGSPEIEYDLRDVYRRIYAGRLVSIDAASPGDLRFVTGCDCTLTTELRANGWLIIDISDGPPPANNPYEVSLEDADDRPMPWQLRPDGSKPIEIPVTTALTAPQVLPMDPDEHIRRAAADLRADLAEEIGRAAVIDLVELAPGVSAESLRQPVPHPINPPAPPGPADEAIAAGPNMRIITEAERALSERSPPSAADPSQCARLETVLNPNTWIEGGIGPAGIHLDRKTLIDLGGEAYMNGYRDLIRGYLYLTFGREALAVLAAAPDSLAHASLYGALATIVEGQTVEHSPLSGLSGCAGHTGLWARLADPGAVAHKGDTTRPAAFAVWPEHLRRILGPRLVTAYLEAGDTETAQTIFRAVARVADPADPAFQLLASQLGAPESRTATQSRALTEIARSHRPESAPALVEIIDARIDEGVPVGADLAMEAGALAFEMSEPENAKELRAAEIRALIHDGSWKAASLRLNADEPLPDRGELLSTLIFDAVESASDPDLLWLAAKMAGESQVSRGARQKMAERVAKMGLADMARSSLDLGAAVPTAAERRILAEIALHEDRPAIAEAYLAGLDTAEDEALMARVKLLRDRQKDAPGTGGPAEVALPEASATLPIEVARGGTPEPAPPEGGLQVSRSLLGDSASLRGELEELLGTPVFR